MNLIDVIDRAERLARLHAYGTERAVSSGIGCDGAIVVVRQVLS